LYYALRGEGAQRPPSLRDEEESFLTCYTGWNSDHEHDAAAYNRAAMETLRTGVPRTRSGSFFSHAPLYAYFLAGSYAVGGVRLLSVVVPQAALAGATALLLGLAAYRIAPWKAWQTALLATGLFLINLRFAMYVGSINPTCLLLFWVALAMWAATWWPKPWAWILFVTALVAGTFTQAGFLLMAGAGALWLGVRASRQRQWAALVGVGTILVVMGIKTALPFWVARGDSLHQTDTGGIVWEANNPYYESMNWTSLWERRPGNPWSDWRPSAEEQRRYDDYWRRGRGNPARAAWLWIRENPAQYGKLCFIRLRATLGPFTGMMSPRHRAISTVYWLLIFPAGVCGWWRLRRLEVSRLALLMGLVVMSTEVLVITEWYLRYRLPVDWLLTMYAAVSYGLWFGKGSGGSDVNASNASIIRRP